MDPQLITAEDKHRAPASSLSSPNFRRMLRLVVPHRRFIVLGLVASVVFAFLHSVSVVAVLPVLKVMLSEEGLHGWVDRIVVEERLRAKLDVPESGEPQVMVDDLKFDSPLKALGVRPNDRIVSYSVGVAGEVHSVGAGVSLDDEEAVGAFAFLAEVCSAEPGEQLVLSTRGADGVALGPVTVTLENPSFERKMMRWAAQFVPVVRERGDRVTTLVIVVSVMVGLSLLANVARFVSQYYVAVGVLRSVMDLRRTLYRKVLRLPMDFFSQDVSDTVSRFVQDAQEIQRGLMALFGKMLREPIKALFLLIAALKLNAQMTLIMLVVGPVVVVIFWVVGRKIRKANSRLLRTYGMMIGALSTTMHAIGVVKAYNAENMERQHLWGIDRRMFKHQLKIAKLEAFMRPMLEVLGVLGIAAVTLWLGAHVINREIRLEDFAASVIALGMLIDPLRKMSDVYPSIMRSAAGANRIYSVIDSPEEAELLQGAVDLPVLSERIEFKDVTFKYPNAPEPSLRDINATINAGETVALVGPNGSGKTTLTKMIIRFHDPQSGAVYFDGADVRKAKLKSLRRQISLVSQDPVVFAMTAAENIAYGTRDAGEQRILHAAEQAHAAGFIKELENGFDEVIGERGSTLSGGQRQRICIARAILRDAPILIFDEATSQIDSESELEIQKAIRDFSKGRTTIIVAHRLSTIRFASRVIVMDRGRIVDTGTHDELFERCELYATLCRTQFGE